MAKLGVDSPVQPWQEDRAAALLGEAYESFRRHALTGVLVRAGIKTVPSVRKRLIGAACNNDLDDSSFEEALEHFRRDAAKARIAEISWLADNLSLDTEHDGGESLTSEERSSILLRLWFELPV